MVIEMQQEVLAAGLRRQIESLACVMEEIKNERLEKEAIAWRLRAIELELRRLRS